MTPPIFNPYAEVKWDSGRQLTGCTHIHCVRPEQLAAFIAQGLEFATLSNYYPSAPWYPLASITGDTFRRGQNGGIRNGSYVKTPVDFSSFTGQAEPAGSRVFPEIPAGLLEAPNAEHHWFADCGRALHITAPGATLTSGHFDLRHEFGVEKAGWQLGFPLPWRKAFKLILDSLTVPDGGGIVIAHPVWSHLPLDFILELLDSDDRVLGIEIYNDGCSGDYTESADALWDAILATGRRCFGFCVQDHPADDLIWRGRSIILPEEPTAESALRALRRGRFYGALTGKHRFEYIRLDGGRLTAACDAEASWQLISRRGIVADTTGRTFSYELPVDSAAEHGYWRLSARFGKRDDKLFSQPFMLPLNQKEK